MHSISKYPEIYSHFSHLSLEVTQSGCPLMSHCQFYFHHQATVLSFHSYLVDLASH